MDIFYKNAALADDLELLTVRTSMSIIILTDADIIVHIKYKEAYRWKMEGAIL